MDAAGRAHADHARRVALDATLVTVLGLAGLIAFLAGIGGDARWVAALGKAVLAGADTDTGMPYAAADSDGWPNVLVLAELVLHGMTALAGDRGLLAAHVVAVAAGLALLAADGRRGGAGTRSTAAALALLVVGAAATFLIVRLSLFSLALMPLLLALLRAEHRRPSGRVWLVVPLLALWSNLHGAALLGAAVTGAYLLLGRARQAPALAAAVGTCSLLALVATPALARTPEYYWGALNNELAVQHVGLWERLSPARPLDLVFLGCAAVMLALVVRGRPALWEVVALAGVVVMTATAARHGVWLLMLALAPAARGLQRAPVDAAARTGRPSPLLAGAALSAAALLVAGVVRGPQPGGAEPATLQAALTAAGGSPILAEGLSGEQVIAAGGRVWITNPFDAFSRAEQRRYVAWTETGATRLIPDDVDVVLVQAGGPAAEALGDDPGFRRAAADAQTAVFVREG